MVNGTVMTVVGVMPPRFAFPSSQDLWPALVVDPLNTKYGDGPWLETIGRLKPGVSTDQANAEMATLWRQLEQAFPDRYKGGDTVEVKTYIEEFIGSVTIGDDVEIGANTTVDCGAIEDTVIEDGVRIDNLCHIGHNAHVGAHTAVAGMSGISGSATVGKRCMLAGQSGIVGHITVCDDVVVSGKAVISKNITEPGVYAGTFTAEPAREWGRKVARFRRLDQLIERVRKLEKAGK